MIRLPRDDSSHNCDAQAIGGQRILDNYHRQGEKGANADFFRLTYFLLNVYARRRA
jgi:hypothetical protein